jgi:hypothetical protein
MQTSEKVTTKFIFKLLLLFVLLLTGVALKSPDLTQTIDTKNIKASPASSTLEPDTLQLQRLFFRMVRNEPSSAAL